MPKRIELTKAFVQSQLSAIQVAGTAVPVNAHEDELGLLQGLLSESSSCPFELGYELGRYIMRDQVYLDWALSTSTQTNLIQALWSLTQVASSLFSLTRLSFSFSGFSVGVEARLSLPVELSPEERQPLEYLLIGRNLGMVTSVHQTLIDGPINSFKSFSTHLPCVEGAQRWAQKVGCEVYFDKACHQAIFDIRQIRFKHFVFGELFGQYLSRLQSTEVATASANIQSRVAVLFDATGSYNLSKEEVAAALNLSSRTFSRRLQNEGTHWRKLQSELRLEKAKQLLLRDDLNIHQIADYIGFSSLSAFSSAFSRAVGRSPSEYIRSQKCQTQAQSLGV